MPTSDGMPVKDSYKWIALSNVTLGVLLAVLDGSIVLIAMPSIFRGIHLDPLVPASLMRGSKYQHREEQHAS